MPQNYVPIFIFIAFVGVLLPVTLLAAKLVRPDNPSKTKLMPYECGKDPVGSARDRFSIKFYTVAVIFLLFDIEVLFMIPFAVAFKYLMAQQKISGITYGAVAFVEILIFIATLVVGYIYVWKKGIFDWGIQSRAEARAEAKVMANQKREHAQGLKKAA